MIAILKTLLGLCEGHIWATSSLDITGVSTKIIEIVECARKNHKNITIENNVTKEVEISKANIDRLHLLLDFDVINIENYISNI